MDRIASKAFGFTFSYRQNQNTTIKSSRNSVYVRKHDLRKRDNANEERENEYAANNKFRKRYIVRIDCGIRNAEKKSPQISKKNFC